MRLSKRWQIFHFLVNRPLTADGYCILSNRHISLHICKSKIIFAGSFQNNIGKAWKQFWQELRELSDDAIFFFFFSVLSSTSDNTVSADITPKFVFTVWEYYVVWSTWVNGYSSVHVDWVELVFVKLRGVHPHLAGSFCTPPESV